MSVTKSLPGAFLALAGVYMLVESLGGSERRLAIGDPGPWILPLIVAILLIALGALEAIRAARVGGAGAGEPDEADADASAFETIAPPTWPTRIALVALLLAYVATFERIGFTVTTLVFLFSTMWLLGARTPRSALVSLALSAISTLSIGWLLAGPIGVPLPGVLWS